MSEERELERHQLLIEQINKANTIEELPNIAIPSISRYLAQNVYYDNIHISQTLFKPVVDIIVEKNTFIDKEVKQAFLKVVRENYPNRRDEDYLEKYRQIASSPRIPNMLIEIAEKNKKLRELQKRDNLNNHNQMMKEIRDAYEIKDLPKVGLSELNTKILRAFYYNSFIKDIKISSLRNITEAYLDEKSFSEIEQLVYDFCKQQQLTEEQKLLMSKQIINLLNEDETILYTVQEIKYKEARKLKIYEIEHEDTMQKIKDATRISQLPPNLTTSYLSGYLSGNSVIFKGENRISSTDLTNLTELLLAGKKWDSPEVITELKNLSIKYYGSQAEMAFKLFYEKFSKLPRTFYLVEEINLSKARQTEFIGRSCSNVNVYFIPNSKSPIEAGRFYNCYINRADNLNLGELLPLDLSEIVPPNMDIDSIEWFIQQNYDPTFKAAGGIILNNDETIGNVNTFRPNDGKIGITQEEKKKYDELKELGDRVKSIIQRKKEETDKYAKMQEQFLKMQEQFIKNQQETDKELAELEERIDILTKTDEPDLGPTRRGGRA